MDVLYTFQDGSWVCFEEGRFDGYRVALYDSAGRRQGAPTDSQFFTALRRLGDPAATWALLLRLNAHLAAEQPIADFDFAALDLDLWASRLLAAFAAAMLAEDRKANTVLGRRIKLLGAHQVLLQGFSPRAAAAWSTGRPATEIDAAARQHDI